MTDKDSNFGQFLREARLRRGFTIKELSSLAEVSNGFLSMVETGERKPPSPEILRRLSGPLLVSYETLMAKAGYLDGDTMTHSQSADTAVVPSTDSSSSVFAAFYPTWEPGVSLDEQVQDGYFPLPGELVRRGVRFYTLVPDDGMRELGIRKGQRILVSVSDVESGDIAFCTIGDQAVVRRIFYVDGRIVCQGTGRDTAPIIADTSEVVIVGRVVSYESFV